MQARKAKRLAVSSAFSSIRGERKYSTFRDKNDQICFQLKAINFPLETSIFQRFLAASIFR